MLCGLVVQMPRSARKVLKKWNMTEKQQLIVGVNELNETVRAAEARATEAERQAHAAQQELARS